MANKKIAKIACLSLMGVLLTGCSSSEVIAKPTYYDDHVITGDNGSGYKVDDTFNNLYSIIADAYHDGGSFTTDVLTAVMAKYAVSVFGEYNKVTADAGFNGTTLKAAFLDIESKGSYSIAKKFIDEHKVYQVKNSKGELDYEASMKKVSAVWNSIEERIARAMYEKISGGTYSDRSNFSEQKFLTSLAHDMQKVEWQNIPEEKLYEGLILPSVTKEEVFDKEILHREHYQSSINSASEKHDETYTYIEDNLINTIYSELLVEEYIYEESYNVVGRANGRKVNIISVTANSNDLDSAKKLITSFRDRIFTPVNTVTVGEKQVGPEVTLDDFKIYSAIWNGNDDYFYKGQIRGEKGITSSDEIAKAVFGAKIKQKEGDLEYYLGSEDGKIMKEFDKISSDPYKNDETVESTYTNSGAYSKEVGLVLKRIEVVLKNHVTDGWYIKNGGLSALPETLRTRLFNLAVASNFEEPRANPGFDYHDRAIVDATNNKITYDETKDNNRYIARINGKYYLKSATQSQGSDPKDDIVYFDNSSSTYYIVQVEEAANTSKFVTGLEDGNVYSDEKRPVVEMAIGHLVANTESYQTLAKKHWLEQMGLDDINKYHDQSVYDYFKATYPDLFD